MHKILSSDKDLIIIAGAGTGKSSTLVDYYISQLLKEKGNTFTGIDKIVAITYTDKAAMELKLRIQDNLNRAIENISYDFFKENISTIITVANLDDIISTTTNDQDKVLLNLIKQRQSFFSGYISTIHSFCGRILKENAISANLNPDFLILDNVASNDLLYESAKYIIYKKLENKNSYLSQILPESIFYEDSMFINELIALISLTRSAGYDLYLARKGYEKFFKDNSNYNYNKSEFEKSISILLKLNNELSQSRKSFVCKPIEFNELIANNISNIDLISLQKLYHAICIYIDKNKLNNGLDNIYNHLNIIDNFIKYHLLKIEKINIYMFFDLINDISKEYQIRKAKISSLDYADLEIYVKDILLNNRSIKLNLQNKFIKVMVDEFQDANHMQKQILDNIFSNNSNKLFLVGDEKQAIYKFRGADSNIFRETIKTFIDSNKSIFYLNKNYRSLPDLITFSNSLVETKLIEKVNDNLLLYPDREYSEKADKNIHIYHIDNSSTNLDKKSNMLIAEYRKKEARHIASNIKSAVVKDKIKLHDKKSNTVRTALYSDFVVLFRSFTDINIYELAFKEAEVPYKISAAGSFYDSNEVIDFISILKLIDNRHDKLLFATILRSPFVALSDQSIIELAIDEKGNHIDISTYIENIENIHIPISDYDEKLRFIKFIKLYEKWKNIYTRVKLIDLFESIINDSDYDLLAVSEYSSSSLLHNIDIFADMIRAADEKYISTIPRFIEFFKKSKKGNRLDYSINQNAVSFLTVHKAKGLEFPVVIIANIANISKRETSMMKFDNSSGLAVKYIDRANNISVRTPFYDKVSKDLANNENSEELRVLYVAITRARDHLMIFIPDHYSEKNLWINTINEISDLNCHIVEHQYLDDPKIDKKQTIDYSYVEQIFDSISRDGFYHDAHFSQLEKINIETKINATELVNILSDHNFNSENLNTETTVSIQKSNFDIYKEIGQTVHDILYNIDILDYKTDLKKYIYKKLGFLPDSKKNKLIRNILKILGKEPFIYIKYKTNIVREEQDVLIIGDDKSNKIYINVVPDLYYIENDKIILVDYKYSKNSSNDNYKNQILIYSYLLYKKFPGFDIDSYLIFLDDPKNHMIKYKFTKKDFEQLKVDIINKIVHRSNHSPMM